jgi:hypothetical protein
MVLDRWDAEQFEIMKLIGNRRANAYWEADLPREFLKVGKRERERERERDRDGDGAEKHRDGRRER